MKNHKQGVHLKDVAVGGGLLIQTRNTLYTLRKITDHEFTLRGHAKYCPTDTHVTISEYIAVDVPMGFLEPELQRTITTTAVQSIEEFAPDETTVLI